MLRCIAKKVCIACSRTNKIVPLTDLNKHLYSGKSEIKVNTNNSSEKIKKKIEQERTQRLSLSSLQQDVLPSVMFVFLVPSSQVTQRFESNLLRSSGANTATWCDNVFAFLSERQCDFSNAQNVRHKCSLASVRCCSQLYLQQCGTCTA